MTTLFEGIVTGGTGSHEESGENGGNRDQLQISSCPRFLRVDSRYPRPSPFPPSEIPVPSVTSVSVKLLRSARHASYHSRTHTCRIRRSARMSATGLSHPCRDGRF